MPSALLIVLDGLGVGELPDATSYGDAGSDTLGNTARAVNGLDIPVLGRLGLGNIHAIAGVPPEPRPLASFGRLREVSAGKDSTTGHWELLGVVTTVPFPTYPEGFPAPVIQAFREATGYDILGNVAASGTEIIERLGAEHVRTGKLIVYTSADSVFQIAAHEDIVPLAELYRVCELARELLVPPHQVSRVIARPFLGTAGDYQRTPHRRDFSVKPPDGLLLPTLAARGVRVVSIGKIYDLYAGVGIGEKHSSKSNDEGMAKLLALYAESADEPILFLLNLVDFDMLWGHRNDPEGMAQGLEEFDSWLATFMAALKPDDLLLLTADHGNDPTTASTDHSREYVPLLAYQGCCQEGVDLGTRASFADLGATLAEFFAVPPPAAGTSFLSLLRTARTGGRPA